jgi:hypothetical protein
VWLTSLFISGDLGCVGTWVGKDKNSFTKIRLNEQKSIRQHWKKTI